MVEDIPNFGAFLNGVSTTIAPTFKVSSNKKRKAADADTDIDLEPKSNLVDTTDGKTLDSKPQKASAKGKVRGRKIKSKEVEDEFDNDESLSDGESGMARVSKKRM